MYNIIPINEFTYSLNIQGDDEYKYYLYKSIQKIIKGSHIDCESNNIYFSAEKVVPFPNQKISYYKCIQLVDDLTKQMMILRKLGYGFYGFDMNDILTIDDHFVFCSTQNMLPLVDDQFIFITPIKRPKFSSPELNKLTSLPANLSYKCCYYSLGTFISVCLLGSEELESLHDTKIYWFIKNCTNKDIDKRILLLL